MTMATRGEGRKTPGQKLVKHLHGRGGLKMMTDEVLALMRGPPANED
jgi:hypothetical protein